MTWTIEFAPQVEKDLKRLGRPARLRIMSTLHDRIASLDDPRSSGHALVGEWSGYWRYRVGDYRIITRIEGARLVIGVIKIAHRREVYNR